MREIDIILLFVLINLVIYFSYSNISKFINIYDIPNVRKIHKTKTPLIGGVIFLLNILFFYFFFNFNFFIIKFTKWIVTPTYVFINFYTF